MLKLGRYLLTLKNCIEALSYASTAYVVASYGLVFDCFVKIWATCKNFLGKWFTVPPGRKLPVRICEYVHNEDQNGGRRQARQFF